MILDIKFALLLRSHQILLKPIGSLVRRSVEFPTYLSVQKSPFVSIFLSFRPLLPAILLCQKYYNGNLDIVRKYFVPCVKCEKRIKYKCWNKKTVQVKQRFIPINKLLLCPFEFVIFVPESVWKFRMFEENLAL